MNSIFSFGFLTEFYFYHRSINTKRSKRKITSEKEKTKLNNNKNKFITRESTLKRRENIISRGLKILVFRHRSPRR